MAQPEIVKDIDARVKIPGDTMTGNLTAPIFIGSLQGNASSADKLNINAGSLRQPVYFDNSGQPVIAADDYVFYDEVSGTIPSGDSNLFVLKSGDTMTGSLGVSNGKVVIEGNDNSSTVWLRPSNDLKNAAFLTQYHGLNNLYSLKFGRYRDGALEGQWEILHTGNMSLISPSAIGAVGVYSRNDIGISPNFDNPGVNGLFEIRSSSETTGETGTKPFDGFGALLNLKTPDNIAMLQIAGGGTNFFIRARQQGGVTMKDIPWEKIATATDLATKVSKNGDTMQGDIFFPNGKRLWFWQGGTVGYYFKKDSDSLGIYDHDGHLLLQFNYNGKPIAFGGNRIVTADEMAGFPKIATGSYVGTGTSDPFGGTQQNSLTFDFEPKMLAVVADCSNMFFAGFLIVRGQTYSDGIGGMANTSVSSQLHITWSGNTVSWWSSNRIDIGTKYPQMNVENKTYRYIALG